MRRTQFLGSETNRSIPKRWKRYLPTSCPLTLLLFDEDMREAAASSSRLQRGDRSVQGARRTDDELLRLHNEEEHQSTQEKPRPDPKRDRLVVEQSLQRRRISEQELQHYDRADAERQVLVAEMCRE